MLLNSELTPEIGLSAFGISADFNAVRSSTIRPTFVISQHDVITNELTNLVGQYVEDIDKDLGIKIKQTLHIMDLLEIPYTISDIITKRDLLTLIEGFYD